MSAKHTPGPWQACAWGDYGDFDGRCTIVLGDGNTVRVAIVLGHQEESEADARLIAAAPDLLKALRGLLRFSHPTTTHDVEDFNRARAAIAKAVGSAS